MAKEKKQQTRVLDFAILGLIFVGGLFAFWWWRYAPRLQFWIVVTADGLYVLWGILHHYLDQRLSRRVIAEYLLIGLLVLLSFSLILR